MASLLARLSAAVGEAFADEGLDAAYGQVRPSDRPDLAPFQCNGALAAAKQARRKPRDIAEAVAARLSGHDVLEIVEIAGPGFLNIAPTQRALHEAAAALGSDEAAGAYRVAKPRRVIIDYGGPNVAKPLHVGHLRAALIGESVKRIMRAAGDEAVGDIHLGDWGLQMGQLVAELERRRPELPYFGDGDGPYPDESPVSVDDLAELYPAASAACRSDEARMAEAQAATAELQRGHPGYRALWRHFLAVSKTALRSDYECLGVTFELWRGEADVQDRIEPLREALNEAGLLERSDGAQIVRVARADDKRDIPPLLYLKSNGSVGYGSTDLATLHQRAEEGYELCVYVVDKRQAEHFEQVFRAAELLKLYRADQLDFAGFGTMNGPDGRPFKTREGGVLRLADLIALVEEKALARVAESGVASELPEEERVRTATMIGMAALKFADLSNPRTTDYIFDPDRFVAFEGKTGPYLLYAAVRIAAILAKVEDVPDDARIGLEADEERQLVLTLTGYADAMEGAYERRMPHLLCDHAFALAQSFSRFYAACPVATESDPARRASRTALTRLVHRQLRLVLDQLGIEVPARM